MSMIAIYHEASCSRRACLCARHGLLSDRRPTIIQWNATRMRRCGEDVSAQRGVALPSASTGLSKGVHPSSSPSTLLTSPDTAVSRCASPGVRCSPQVNIIGIPSGGRAAEPRASSAHGRSGDGAGRGGSGGEHSCSLWVAPVAGAACVVPWGAGGPLCAALWTFVALVRLLGLGGSTRPDRPAGRGR